MNLALTIGLAVAGSCVGSYCATAGLRMARDEQSITGRSACDSCGAQLSFAQTAPIISYLRLGGACALCRGRIDPLHLAGEVAGAGIVVCAAAVAEPLRATVLALMGFALLTASVVDIRTKRLPDAMTLAVTAAALALCVQKGFAALVLGAVTGIAAFVILELSRRAFLWLRRRPGLGFGDVKLFAALAIVLGAAAPWALVAAAATGLVVALVTRPADGRIAFGPFIAAAGWGLAIVAETGGSPWSS